MARLLSVNVGLPREVTSNGKSVRTAICVCLPDGLLPLLGTLSGPK